MILTVLGQAHVEEAGCIFAANYRRERAAAPTLPERFEDPREAAKLLERLLAHSSGVASVEDGRLAGYLGWWLVDGFRSTPRRAAYVPEWAHGVAVDGDSSGALDQATTGERIRRVYSALYRAAAENWTEAGCQVHAITVLGQDRAAVETWFWNGFGLWVVDGIRDLSPLGARVPEGYTLRLAGTADAALIAELETEHWQHYARPPVLMQANNAADYETCAALIANPHNRVWLAMRGEEAGGYLRFEPRIDGAAAIIGGEGLMGITGAYIRADQRGKGLSPALLDAALADFAACGLRGCAVDFESFNPEAAAFWPKYFKLVALSMVRVPEKCK